MKRKYLFWKKFGAGVLIIIISILSIAVLQPISAEENNPDEIIQNYSFTEPEITEVNVSSTIYHEVAMTGTSAMVGPGLPILPVKPLKVLLPQKGVLKSINVTYEDNTSLGDGYNLMLGAEPINISEQQNHSNMSNFNTSKPYPIGLFNNIGIQNFRGYSILVLNLYPVHYIGDTGEIYYYENMSVTIKTSDSGSIHPLFRGLKGDEILMKQIVDDYSMNYTYNSTNNLTTNSCIVKPLESYDYVIITTEKLKNASPPMWEWRPWYTFRDLADHKNASGINTTIVTVEEIKKDSYYWNTTNPTFNDTQAQIRSFITDAHLNWETDYFLLGGDIDKVPGRYLDWSPYLVPQSVLSDLYYACLNGSYNEDNDERWGEPLDGAPGGDTEEAPGSGKYYSEVDSKSYGSRYEVGLFTPQLNLTGANSIKLKFSCNLFMLSDHSYKDIIFLDVKTYSNGTDSDNLEEDLSRYNYIINKNITLYFNPSNYTDTSNVYIEFYFYENGTCASFPWQSLNIDDVSIKIGDKEILWESFEGSDFPPANDTYGNWTQIVYSGNKSWTKEYYRVDVDLIPDVYIGRACVDNGREVRNFVLKTIAYENTLNHDPYLEKALLVGGKVLDDPLIWGGDFKDEIIDFNDSYIETFGIPSDEYEIDTLYDRNWDNNWWGRWDFRKKVNPGVHIMNHGGHGLQLGIVGDKDGKWKYKFNNLDAYFLTNNKLSFIYSFSCLVGQFNYAIKNLSIDCFGEYLTVKTRHGAFATIMNSESGINYKKIPADGPSQRLDREFWDAIYHETINKLGPALQDSRADNLYLLYQFTGHPGTLQNKWGRQCYYQLNLLGDPTVSIKIPEKNHAPNTPNEPQISSHLGKYYTFYTSTTDPEGDDVSYQWRWDDDEGTHKTKWKKFKESGDTVYWTKKLSSGYNNISVRARDTFLANSSWSGYLDLTVSFDSNMLIYSSPAVLGKDIQFYGQASVGDQRTVQSWNYSFDDGNYSNEQNTNHTFDEVGTYNVTLTVTDSENITSNVTTVVKVVILKSDINCSSDHGEPEDTISFNDLSDGYYDVTSWHWDFGDGNSSNNRNTSHAYAAEGIYTVSLNVTDAESNTNISYQTIYIDSSDPEITSFSCNLDEVGYGYNITITANLSDSVSGIKNATVNITYPDDTYGNFTMNNTNGSTYEYVFKGTCQLGDYSYTIRTVDNAENSDTSSVDSFTVLRSFGFPCIGGSNISIGDTITGTKFKVNLKGVADNISVYLNSGNVSPDYHYRCVIYRHNDSKLMGISEEKNVSTGKGWRLFNFSVPKPVLINDTEYVLACWSDNYTVTMYYYNTSEEEEYYDDGTSTLSGHYFEGVYNYTPEFNNFEHENKKYSIYSRYTPDNSPPVMTNISDTPTTVGFGFNVTITADISDNASGVDSVKVNITYPDDTYGNYTMNNTGNNTYEYVFFDTWLVGQYNYTIWTVDYAVNSNISTGHSFSVSAQATVSIATLKNSYGANEYINITDPPSPPDDYYLVGRGLTWNEYYNASSARNICEIYNNPINYQNENGNWNTIECNISMIDNDHPAYGYGYRAGNEYGLFNVYFKPNAQNSWPVAFAYNKSTVPETHVVRTKLVGVGYLDPSNEWAYEYLQSIQSSQGEISSNSVIYENVFSGTDVVWTYGNNGLKEEIIMSNTTKTLLQDHPPSEYGLSNQNSYLVFITKLDYYNLNLYNASGMLTGNFTTSHGRIDFKDAFGRFKCTLPVGEAYELFNESVRQSLTYRVLQYNGNYYLLSGLKVVDLNEMTFPVVIDPTLTVYSSTFDGEIMCDGPTYSIVHDASEGLPFDYGSTFSIGQRCESIGPPRYFIWRGFVYFNTSSIPSNDLIDSVTLSLYKDCDFSSTDFDIVIQNGQPTYPHSYLVPGDYNKNHYSGDGGSINTQNFSDGYNNITLNNYSWINTSSITKLCLRSSRDINSNTPSGDEYVTVYSSNYPQAGRSPKLVIEYRNQSKINNNGSTDIKGYLIMRVDYYNVSPTWVSDYVAVIDTTPRVINSSEELALDLIFNGLVNTNDLSHGDGTYRVYAAFRDPDGNILQTNDEKDMVSWYEFEVDAV